MSMVRQRQSKPRATMAPSRATSMRPDLVRVRVGVGVRVQARVRVQVKVRVRVRDKVRDGIGVRFGVAAHAG